MSVLSPDMAAPAPPHPALSLRLFGPFVVTVHGRPVPKVRSQKERWLLALLVLRAPAPLERSWLAATLWPETTDEAALYNLRRTLRFLRDALGPEADRLQSPTPRTLRLDLDGADCDVAAFDAALRRGDPAFLAEAAALYHGPLLLGCSEEWALPERDARERAVLDALEALAAGAQERGDWAEAAAHLRSALEIDPLRETALRALLTTLAAQGCHPAAMEAYHAFRRRVRDELNAEVDPDTVALFRRLQVEGRREAPSAPTPSQLTDRLPTPLTTLIGRDSEITAVAASLEASRLVTLTGPGGVGKTRLALAVARSLHAQLSNGAWFADFAPLADAKLLTAALITTFGLREATGRTPNEVLAEFLRHRQLLLVLDNCEHLAEACAHLARGLLHECPALQILATSREPLRVPGEVAWPVPGLPPGEAARLFAERAMQSHPAFRLTPTVAGIVADICRRLDGIPLAIEMAAARTRALPVAQIASRLADALRLLSEPGGDLLPRHQTLRATLDWSYDLLTAAEKAMLARLSVFAGGWTLEAAEAVCAEPAEDKHAGRIALDDILDLLAGLVDRSLVVYEEPSDGTGRYRLLETVRQYASGRLMERGETDRVQERTATWFLALAEEAEPQLTGSAQGVWLSRLETEHDNLRAGLSWYLSSGERGAEEGLRLAGALSRFWDVRGYFSEGRQWLRKLLEQATGADCATSREASAARAKALNGAGNLASRQGDYNQACAFYEQALTTQRRLGDRQAIARTLYNLGLMAGERGDYARARILHEEGLTIERLLGNSRGIAASISTLGGLAYYQGDYPKAKALYEESLALRRQLKDQRTIANSLHNLGLVVNDQGDAVTAQALEEESLAVRRQLGDKHGIAASLNTLGNLAHDRGDNAEAQALLQEGLALRRQMQDRRGIATSLHNLGDLAHDLGDHVEARALHEESLNLRRQLRDQRAIAASLQVFGNLAYSQRDYARTCRLWGAAASLRESIGVPLHPVDKNKMDTRVDAVREALGEEDFAVAWAEGQAMTWEQAVDFSLSEEV